jgi:ABC-2 type transport system permease protein
VRVFGALVTNELERMLRHRWLLIIIPYAIALVGYGIFVGVELHNGYQFGSHPPPDWRGLLQAENSALQQDIANIQQEQSQPGNQRGGPAVRPGNGGGIALDQRLIADNQYHLDHNAPPPNLDLVTAATSISLGFGMFVLTLVIGWLASEMIAEERAHRTMTLLLARPVGRTQLLAAKAITATVVGAVLVVIAVAMGYLLTALFAGNFGDASTNVIILRDGNQPLSDGNAVVMSSLSTLALELAVSLVGVVCLVGMSLLLSSLFRSAGVAIAVTLGFLFVVPSIVITVGNAAHLFGIDWPAQVIQYLWFTNFEPANAIVGQAAEGPNTGLNHLSVSIPVLAAWAVAFYGASWWFLAKRDETAN